MISGDRTLAGGKRGAFYNTLEEFHKYWEQVDIICPKISRGSTSGGFEVEPLFGNVFIHPSPWPLWLQPWWILKKGLEILKANSYKSEAGNCVMTVHEYPPFYNGIGARLLWNKINIPYVLEIHHIPGYPKAADFKEWIYKIAMRCFIKYDAAKAKAVRVVNQKQVPGFLIRAGVPENKIIYIPSLYIDLDIFKPTDVKKQYDLIFIGRLAKNKGVNLLLEALAILSKTHNLKPKTLIVGDGPMLKKLKLQTINYQLQTNVTFHGWAKDSQEVARLLNESRILVVPSYNEGGPRVALEAMACGVPVLATPVGIVPDVIKNAGEIIDWNPADISKKVLELLGNTAKYQEYRANGLKIASHFEKRAAIKNYAEKLLSTLFTRTLKK